MKNKRTQQSLIRVSASLESLLPDLMVKIEKSLNKSGAKLEAMMESQITWNTGQLRNDIRIVTKKKVNRIFLGVGITSPQENARGKRALAKLYDSGWSPWPKGLKTNAKGRGWRRGKKNPGARNQLYRTNFYTNTYNHAKATVPRNIRNLINRTLKKANLK